jgi:hypothetical protein
MSATDNAWYEISWPNGLDVQRVGALLQSLSGSPVCGRMRFIADASTDGIRHYIAMPGNNASAIVQMLTTFLPDIELSKVKSVAISPTTAAEVRLSKNNLALNATQAGVVSYALLSSMQGLRGKETVRLEWYLGGNMPPVTIPRFGRQFEKNTMGGRFWELFYRQPREWDAATHASMQTKHSAYNWRALCLVGVTCNSPARSQQLLSNLVGAMRAYEAPGVHFKLRQALPARLAENHLPREWPVRINAEELTGLLAWPLGDQQFSGIRRISSRHLATALPARRHTRIVAQSNIAGNRDFLGLTARDALMHTHVIGPTGVGKTTLLLNLITQDIADGRAVIVVDPKGDLVQGTLERILEHRKADVIVLDPSDNARPVGLNPLAHHGKNAALVADDILAIFSSLYGNYFGPRTQDIMHAGLLTLCSTPNVSLCALPMLYTNPTFRNSLAATHSDPLGLGSFWSWFDGISEAQRATVLAPVMNKLRAFLLRPAIRQVIGQSRPRLNIEDCLNDKKILLVNLAKGSLGRETSQLFGSLVVAQVWQAIQGRIHTPTQYRAPAFVYVDEVQDYLHLPTDISDVLAQARSYGVGLILAHQHLSQLPKELRNGVISNARSRICFQLGHDDALAMSKNSKLLNSSDFENLDRHHIYARLVGNGEVLPWASGVTLPPTEPVSDPDTVRTLSREQYGQDKADVEADIAAQIAGKTPRKASPIGRKRSKGGRS